jgi:integrase
MPRRAAAIELADNTAGVTLYKPTEKFLKWRLTYRDPFTGNRVQPAYHSLEQGTEAFNEAVAYVNGARAAHPVVGKDKDKTQPTVDDVMAATVARWKAKNREPEYIQGRVASYNLRLAPLVGELTVIEWGRTDLHCLSAIAALRDAGLAPATIQNYGALLRQLVTVAQKEKWLPRTMNPMEDVAYTAKSTQDSGALCIEPKMRPTTTMVNDLIDQYRIIGEATGRDWLWLMPDTAGFAGPRFGEQTALRVRSYDVDRHGFDITEAWKRPRGDQARSGLPKNGRARFVHLRGSVRDAIVERVEQVRAAEGPDGLLFPGPKGPMMPWTEGEMRNVFVRAGRDAGWPLTGGGLTPKGQKYRPHPVIPYMNLRHHAATWMHEQGLPWDAVSRALGHATVGFTLARYVRKHQEADELTRSVLDAA